MSLAYNGMVAVVTGAGGGLGRSYALEFAKRGAFVVVNDLGSSKNGEGYDNSAANGVVTEIQSFGGNAFPNYDSVEHGDKIIDCAMKRYGKIDILINNAGILRDRSFIRMSDEDWVKIQNIHLFGAYKITKAAWKHMKEQNFGRIIFTSSASGMYGNFGQANYSSAKLGLVGLCKSLAIEGSKNNINCNAIAPVAASRMTRDLLPFEVFSALKPDYVSSLVLYLSHPSCMESGCLFEVGAGWIGKARWEVSNVRNGKRQIYTTPEAVRDSWQEITNFTHSSHPSSVADSISNVASVINCHNNELIGNEKVDTTAKKYENETFYTKCIGTAVSYKIKPYSFRDSILYALSVGVDYSTSNLKFLYEGHPDFTVLPTFFIIPSFDAMMTLLNNLISDPNMDFSLSEVLHAEQYLEIFQPFKFEDQLTANAEVVDVLDKRNGALIVINVNLCNSKDIIITSQFSIYVKRKGGFKGKSNSDKVYGLRHIPSRKPDLVLEKYIDTSQTALYRLNGDLNALHIDPHVADLAGFKHPILHGLCLFGITGFQILTCFCDKPDNFRRIKVRFSKPVIPGQTVLTEIWKEQNTVHFQCRTKETGDICLSGGYVELQDANNIQANL